DATYIKVRESDKVVSKAVYIGLGVRVDGTREIIGLKVAQAESEEIGKNFLSILRVVVSNHQNRLFPMPMRDLKMPLKKSISGQAGNVVPYTLNEISLIKCRRKIRLKRKN